MVTIKHPDGMPPEYTAEDWAARLAGFERTAALGDDNGDGTIVHQREDGYISVVWQDGLDSARAHVAGLRAEVAALEAAWLR